MPSRPRIQNAGSDAPLAWRPAIAAEILACRRLVRGCSDTHARGLCKFDRALGALPALEGRPDAADWLRRLCKAALQDEAGNALDGALRTIDTFAKEAAQGPRQRQGENA